MKHSKVPAVLALTVAGVLLPAATASAQSATTTTIVPTTSHVPVSTTVPIAVPTTIAPVAVSTTTVPRPPDRTPGDPHGVATPAGVHVSVKAAPGTAGAPAFELRGDGCRFGTAPGIGGISVGLGDAPGITADADAQGRWVVSVPTSYLRAGQYSVKALCRSQQSGGDIWVYPAVTFTVPKPAVAVKAATAVAATPRFAG